MKKKLTKEETAAYITVQRLRGQIGAKKAGKKGMSKRGKKGAEVRWGKKKSSGEDTKKTK